MSTQALERAKSSNALDAARERAGFGANKLIGVSMKDLTELADAAVASGMFADVKNAGIAKMKILAGREVGLEPIASLQAIHFFNNRVVYGAGVYAGLIKSSDKYDYSIVEHTSDKCILEFFERRSGRLESVGKVEYNKDMAKAAGLSGKDVYTKFGDDMYFAGAIRKGFRRHCVDLLRTPSQKLADQTTAEVEYLAPAPELSEEDRAQLESRIANLCRFLNDHGDEIKWTSDKLNDHVNALLSTELGVNALNNRETFQAVISSLETRLDELANTKVPAPAEPAANDEPLNAEPVLENEPAAAETIDADESKLEDLRTAARDRYRELENGRKQAANAWLGTKAISDLDADALKLFLEDFPEA